MATAISQLAEKTPGKESIAIESFAHALRQVIKRIVYLNFLKTVLSLVTNNYC